MHHTTRHIQKIPPDRRLEAARRLTAGAASGDSDAAARFLHVAETHQIRLECLWASSEAPDAPLGQTVLIVPSPGATGMVFTSPPISDGDVDELASVIDAAGASLSGVKLIQTLLAPHETRAVRAFQRAGFQHVGDLLYMRRTWRKPRQDNRDDWPEGVSVRPWRDGDDPHLALALERSYIDTLDCPALCGMRTTEDVIESHRSTGEFTPDLWWIVRRDDQPAGVLLLSPCPSQAHTELTYLGLAPELRGIGLARRLLLRGLAALAHRRHRDVTCAVDARNTPARKLYESEGFREFARRIAYVKPIQLAAGEQRSDS